MDIHTDRRGPPRPRLRSVVAGAAIVAALAACGVDGGEGDDPAPTPDDANSDGRTDLDEPDDVEDPAAGLETGGLAVLTGQTDDPVGDVAASVEQVLAGTGSELVFEVDHAGAAASVGLDLPATRLMAFSVPELDRALLQADPRLGLDLPTKLLVWDEDGTTRVGVNEPPFLAQRYDLDPGLAVFAALDERQRDLLAALGVDGLPAGLNPVAAPEGVEVRESEDGFAPTLRRARSAIESAGLELIAEVDHAAAAADAGEDLAANTLLVFGAPEVGSELLASERTTGIDLPQKLLVYDDDGTHVAYTTASYLADRHLLTGVDQALQTVSSALTDVVTAATSGD